MKENNPTLTETLARLDAIDQAVRHLVQELGGVRELIATLAAKPAAPTEGSPAPPETPEAGPDSRALHREIQELLRDAAKADLAGMPDPRLRHWVQTTVARARHYQECTPQDLAPKLDRLVRRMHRLTVERSLGFIFGLKRDATCDWLEVAERARHGIEKYDADTARPLHPIRSERRFSVAGTKPREVAEPTPIPKLAVLSRQIPVLVFGGQREHVVLDRLRQDWDLSIEWVGCLGPRQSKQAVERIRGGSYCAVVVLEGRVSHSLTEELFDTLRRGTTPWTRCRAPGLAQLREALVGLEERIARDEAVAV